MFVMQHQVFRIDIAKQSICMLVKDVTIITIPTLLQMQIQTQLQLY